MLGMAEITAHCRAVRAGLDELDDLIRDARTTTLGFATLLDTDGELKLTFGAHLPGSPGHALFRTGRRVHLGMWLAVLDAISSRRSH